MFTRLTIGIIALAAGAASAQTVPPLGLLPPIERVETQPNGPAIAELGRMLFFEPRLSGDGSTACADCHDPMSGWADGTDLARGYPGTMHFRNSQTVVNTAYITGGFHWDAGLKSLSHQVHDAFGAAFIANVDAFLAEERLRQIPDYRLRFEAIWGEGPTMATISEAIATFERTLISDDSPFDRFLTGDRSALSAAAQRGYALFNGKANCIACHNGPLGSDERVHNTSVPPNPAMQDDPLRNVTFRVLMRKLGVDPEVYEALDRDPGRYISTGKPQDIGAFRTPPLRYLIYTAPYMHNGAFWDLREVVEFYNDGGTQDVFGNKSPLITPLGLSDSEMDDLVAFLESMSGSEVTMVAPTLPDYASDPVAAAAGQVTLASLTAIASRQQAASAEALDQLVQQTSAPDPGQPAPTQSGKLTLVLQPVNGEAASQPQIPATTEAPATAAGQTALVMTTPGLAVAPAGAAAETPQPLPATASPANEAVSVAEPAPTPAATDASRVQTVNGERTIVVGPGDTLGRLAREVYGDPNQYLKIYEANRDRISNPNVLILGAVLRLPE